MNLMRIAIKPPLLRLPKPPHWTKIKVNMLWLTPLLRKGLTPTIAFWRQSLWVLLLPYPLPRTSLPPPPLPMLPHQIFPSGTQSTTFSSISPNVTQPLNPLSPILFEESNSSHLFDDTMDHDGEEDIFLDLEDLHDPAISAYSSKKRKLEEGEEASSFSHD